MILEKSFSCIKVIQQSTKAALLSGILYTDMLYKTASVELAIVISWLP